MAPRGAQHLLFKPDGAPEQVLKRGNDYLCEDAKNATLLGIGRSLAARYPG